MNLLGLDGNVLICKFCGLYRYLMVVCFYSWENMVKVNVCLIEEEEFVLFIGY